MSDARVSICIPTRNQSEFIADALESAFAQTVQPFDVVVSDDAGTDNTQAVVEQFRRQLPADRRERLSYDRSPVPLGIGGNFDRALRLGKGEFCVKLDSDDILEKKFVESLLPQLQANPQAGWAHCNVLNIRPDGLPIGLAHTRKRSGFYPAETALPAYLRHNDTCHCVLIRKSAYVTVGGYRLEMNTCEDWLLWLEMLLGGWGYVFAGQPLARMRKYASRPLLMSKRRMAFVESARFMVPRVELLLQHHPAELLKLPLPEALDVFHAATARLCVVSGCDEIDPTVRRALFAAAKDFNPVLKNRLWLAIGSPLPAAVTRISSQISQWPRNLARAVFQRSLKLAR